VDNQTEHVTVLRVSDEGRESIDDVVVIESPLTIILDNRELATMLCSPGEKKFLAVGFLVSEGLLRGKEQIKRITVDEARGVARVETDGTDSPSVDAPFKRFVTSGCGRGASFYSAADVQEEFKVESRSRISSPEVLALMRGFQRRSEIFRTTGGVHSAALCDAGDILVFSEDIGRHNAIDKIFGRCLLDDIPTEDRIVVTSGRISSEILLKVARRGIPIIISRSAPTSLGMKLAGDLGVTLIGFVRGRRMNAYTHDWRVKSDD